MTQTNQFETIFEYATEAIVITDNKGEIVRLNPAAAKLFGYSLPELKNKRIETLIPSRFHGSHTGHVKKYHTKKKPRSMGAGLDLYAQKKDGSEFPVEVSLSPCILDNQEMVVAFVLDISERKRAEQQARNYQHQLEKEVDDRTLILKEAIANLEDTKKQLDQSLKKERELNQLKSKFISTASHEFRTPLATALSSLSLVEKYSERNEKEKMGRHVDRIKKSIRNLTEIMDDVLSVNKLEEGKVMVNAHEFNLIEYLNDMIAEVNPILKSGQQIKLSHKGLKELHITQDPKLLRHIVLNILSNAIKFSEVNSLITISLSTIDETVKITIEDQGIGIPAEDQDNLFTRFFRAENAGQIQGTGLGLSIVKQYALLLKGDVICESEVNKGSKFTVTLPNSYI